MSYSYIQEMKRRKTQTEEELEKVLTTLQQESAMYDYLNEEDNTLHFLAYYRNWCWENNLYYDLTNIQVSALQLQKIYMN